MLSSKLYIISLLLLHTTLPLLSQHQQPKEIGIGIAVASNPYQFENTHYERIFINEELTINLQDGAQSKVFPFFYKPDYGLYHFICLEKTRSYYKILVNDNEIAYIPNDTNFYFVTWEVLLVNTSVERLTGNNPIKENYTSNSQEIVHNCNPERLKVETVIEVSGEHWLFVSFSPDCDPYVAESKSPKHGWIKWRNGNQLLVDILLLC